MVRMAGIDGGFTAVIWPGAADFSGHIDGRIRDAAPRISNAPILSDNETQHLKKKQERDHAGQKSPRHFLRLGTKLRHSSIEGSFEISVNEEPGDKKNIGVVLPGRHTGSRASAHRPETMVVLPRAADRR